MQDVGDQFHYYTEFNAYSLNQYHTNPSLPFIPKLKIKNISKPS